ncbi:class I SAM-dependent methyltransferase [Brenneria rubrifaciens]|uniref:Class I SAM-dependent methyltransferase n=1 Tax=Brenneria rubrifaciens TaxID=55213 RepID=A0A4P8QP00_9GAMM|nr:class I SAM-dependent methyltransferase [Brenneria rubrifaciens]QCR08126.1 class I SAM-dependent methyltransferase [Brenneria rubrifaciens]
MNNIEKYDTWSSLYSNQPFNPLMESEHIILKRKLQTCCLNRSIIDAACGAGRISKLCIEYGAKKILAFDYSNSMIEKCKKINKHSKLKVIHGNILNIPLADSSFDILVSSLAIGHVNSLFKVLSEAKRVVKKDGEIIISDFHPIRASCGFTRGFIMNKTYIKLEHFIHDISSWIHCCNQLNLKIVDIQEGFIDEKHHNYEQWRNDPDISSKDKFELAFKIPSVWVIHARNK